MSEFEDIYAAYFSDVFRYARSLTLDENQAEELTEETFFRALRSLNRFRGDCEVRVWLCRIARNLFYDEKRRRRHLQEEEPPETLPDKRDFTGELMDRQTTLDLHRILHGLPEPYKEVFSLRIFGELGFGDIGSLFGKSAHWACVTYHRAKEKIQKEMEK